MGEQIRPTDTPGGGHTMIISLPVADHPVTSDTESPSAPRYMLTEPGIGYRFLPGSDDRDEPD